ncbi:MULTISPECIES: hypothetical protein [Nocardia]|uniref:Uncharacterized protein n=1 Tax=Nocardia aurea TaxID=2144174 RepID=A0ABV3FZC0_9NOCA|nr:MULTISPECIES: hypothetical protein [Nocardia]
MSYPDLMNWLVEGYLNGDPIRYPIFVTMMFLGMPLQLLSTLSGAPF